MTIIRNFRIVQYSMKGKVEIYQSNDQSIELDVSFENETVWLSQEQMAALFERDRTVIGRHIRNIFKDEELIENEVCANFAHTTQHGAIPGKTQQQSRKIYNLDVNKIETVKRLIINVLNRNQQ